MKRNILTLLPILLLGITLTSCNQSKEPTESKEPADSAIITGAEQTEMYLPLLKGKNVALTINNSAVIGETSLLDTLLSLGINVVKAFGPEHGVRGDASAGVKIENEVDEKTGIPLVSLYGKHYKPAPEDLEGVDVMIYDIQDVGVKFYTYLSTLHYVMEACAENDVEFIVLDRPNPNDYFVDGPIREEEFISFVGLDPIPIQHGMTSGEYTLMLNGEGWLENGVQCDLTVIEMLNYEHGIPYVPPIAPSPNLNTQQSILLFPSTCLFEGTVISEGRGTYYPFTVIGDPNLKGKFEFSFTPVSIPGMSEHPKHENLECFGMDLRDYDTDIFRETKRLNLSWVKEFYNAYPDKENFFNEYFDVLAGTASLREQIIAGKTDEEIRESWEPGLSQFKETRKKYLIYKDNPE